MAEMVAAGGLARTWSEPSLTCSSPGKGSGTACGPQLPHFEHEPPPVFACHKHLFSCDDPLVSAVGSQLIPSVSCAVSVRPCHSRGMGA